MSLGRLLRPNSIAVIGASPRSFVGSVVLNNLRASSFQGEVFPVNPGYQEVLGYPALPDMAAIESPVDLAVIQISARGVASAVHHAVDSGVHNFVIPGAGFTDSGEVAEALVAELQYIHQEMGVTVVGPNSMGFLDMVTGAAPYIGTVPDSVCRGPVAVVSQSGAAVEAVINAGGRVPISIAVSTGAEATLDLADYLDFFADDDETSAVIMFVEAVRRPDRLLEALGSLERAGKPVAALIVGRSDTARRGIVSHSGRLAPDFRVARAALSQAGVSVVDDLDELIAAGELFAAGVRSSRASAVLVVNSGGEGNMLADIAGEAGVELPPLSQDARSVLTSRWPLFNASNPLDPWGVDDYRDVYPVAIATAAGEDVDLVVVAQDQQRAAGDYERQLGLDLARYVAEACRGTEKQPVFLSPVSQDPPRALVEQCRKDGVALLRGGRQGCGRSVVWQSDVGR